MSRVRPAADFDRSGSLMSKLSTQSRWSGSSEGTTMSDGAGRVAGKVALVTGAARGQGRADAVRLAAEGADIIAVDVCAPLPSVPYDSATPEDLAETVKLIEALDRRVIQGIVDIRDLGKLRGIVDDAGATLGG